jgi:hypothetical protein
MSAGIIVLLSAEKIFLSRSARLMLHSLQIKNYLPDYITYIEAKNFCRIHRSGKKEAKKMVKIYNERLNLEKYGLKANVILKNGTKEYFFSSDTDYDYDIRELVKNCEFID